MIDAHIDGTGVGICQGARVAKVEGIVLDDKYD
jgi:hypothetical protein